MPVHREGITQHRPFDRLRVTGWKGHRNLRRRQYRRAHRHPGPGDARAAVGRGYGADARQSLDGQPIARRSGDVALDDVLGEAAYTVAAHLTLRAVGVEHHHLQVSHIGIGNENQPVAAHAEVPVAHLPRERGPVLFLRTGVYIYVVVARPFHLGESHGLDSWTLPQVDHQGLTVLIADYCITGGGRLRNSDTASAARSTSAGSAASSQWMRGSAGLNQAY